MALTKSLQIGDVTFEFPVKVSEVENDKNYINQLKTINNQTLIGEGNLDIATAQTQTDWNETDTTSVKYINNKPDLSQFITKAVNDLTYYYTKTEVDTKIADVPTMKILVVETLPTEDIDTKTIYLVPKTTPLTDNIYNEYIYVNSKWELIGDTQIDLSNYYTKTEVDGYLEKKANSADLATVATSGNYDDLTGKPTIVATVEKDNSGVVESGGVYTAIDTAKTALQTNIDGKLDNTSYEEWVFTLSDGTTVKKNVYIK